MTTLDTARSHDQQGNKTKGEAGTGGGVGDGAGLEILLRGIFFTG